MFCRAKQSREAVGGGREHQEVGHCEQGNHDERRCKKKPRDDKHDRRDTRGVEEDQSVEGDHAELEDKTPKCQSARASLCSIEACAEDIRNPCN